MSQYKYTLVDKNFIIPEIIIKNEYILILMELYKKIYKRDLSYNSNIYIVIENNLIFESIIKCDNNIFYKISNNNKEKINIDYSFLFLNEIIFNTITNNTNNTNNDMEINIKKKENNKIIIQNDISINNNQQNKDEKSIKNDEKKIKLLKACEEVMDLYQLELSNIKKIELNLISINNKLQKLEDKKFDKIFYDISRTKNEYETWKKIKYGISQKNIELLYKDENELTEHNNINIPILFLAKYNHIDNIIKNEIVKSYFRILNNINIEELYFNKSISFDKEFINFIEKYSNISKKDLHYEFNHDWDYLDNETDEQTNYN
jgi:hypothetical protein